MVFTKEKACAASSFTAACVLNRQSQDSTAQNEQLARTQTELLTDISVDDQGLSEEAKRKFPFYQSIVCGYELQRQSAILNHYLTPAGRHLILIELKDMFDTCKNVLDYCASTSDDFFLPRTSTNKPLIMCGLPRTGSTLLYNLLACDPRCRAPLATDMFIDCVPPVPRTDLTEHQRRSTVIRGLRERREHLTQIISKQSASHPVFPIEEDYLIFRHIGVHVLCYVKTFEQSFESEAWLYDESNKDFAYEYHRLFFQMLNSVDEPASHWVLKGIMHSLYLDTMLHHYPEALLLMTHRNLEDIIPSFCRFIWEAYRFCFAPNDDKSQKLVMTIAFEVMDHMIKRLVKFRKNSEHADNKAFRNICDVDYDDLMQKPIATVRRIYDHFGLAFSDEFEKAMEKWLQENPQGKQGRNPYSLDDLDLTAEDIQHRYHDYIEMFFSRKYETHQINHS